MESDNTNDLLLPVGSNQDDELAEVKGVHHLLHLDEKQTTSFGQFESKI